MKKDNKFKLEGFKCFSWNRVNAPNGCIATCVREEYAMDTLKMAEGKDQEYIITRHGQFSPAINILNIYGSQETRQSKEEIENKWDEITNEILKIEAKNESLLIIGDLNLHVGKAVPNNHSKTSVRGKLLLNLIESSNYTLVNALDITTGGPFTRYERNTLDDENRKSLLDGVSQKTPTV